MNSTFYEFIHISTTQKVLMQYDRVFNRRVSKMFMDNENLLYVTKGLQEKYSQAASL